MAKRLTIQEAEARFPDMVKGQKWAGVNVKYSFLCEDHGKYRQTFTKHDRGQRCKDCANQRLVKSHSLTIEDAEKRHPDLIKGQKWINNSSKYWYFCPKHGRYQQAFNAHNQAKDARNRCPYCNGGRPITFREALIRCPDLIPHQKWIGTQRKHWFLCKVHGKYLQQFNSHISGRNCPICKNQKCRKRHLLTIQEAEFRHPEMIRRQKWRGACAKYWFYCKKHGRYKQEFNSHSNSGQRCPFCKESKGERLLVSILDCLKVPFGRQFKIGDCYSRCYNNRKYMLPFDFDIWIDDDTPYLIEYQGRQHYDAVSHFGGTKALKSCKQRDRTKKNFCRRNRIPLLIIPYWEKDIEGKIRRFLGIRKP
jgi:hypothetical protein